jgi:hypothetical protein
MSYTRLCWTSMLIIGLAARVGAQRNPAPSSSISAVPQRTDVRFQLTPTQNIWTFLLLDSSTGRIWQVHFALSDSAFSGRLSLNDDALVPTSVARVGRFALMPTQNIYTFLLLDQEDGRVWHVQWANEANRRGIMKALAPAQP